MLNVGLEPGNAAIDSPTIKPYKVRIIEHHSYGFPNVEKREVTGITRNVNDMMIPIARGTYQSKPDTVVSKPNIIESKHKSPFKRFFNWLRNL